MVDLVALSGLVDSVEPDYLGAPLVADTASGETVLTVAYAEPFETDSGTGSVVIGGVVYDQIAVDVEASTITISPGLAADADEDDRVNVSPITSNVVAKVTTTDGDVITARVATAHIPYLRIGDRLPEEREAVTIYREGRGYVTLDVPNGTANTDENGVPVIPGEAIDADGGDLDPETIYIDGPPDFYTTTPGFAGGPLLTYAEMAAVADPTWVAVLDGITADNGTIVFNSADTGAIATEYYPVWMVPNGGREFRVVLDDVTLGGSAGGIDTDSVSVEVALQSDDGSALGAYVDALQVIVNDYTTSDIAPKRWYEYVTVYPGSEDGFGVQTPPIQSIKPTEAPTPIDPGDLTLPQVAVSSSQPLSSYATGWTTDHIITIAGLRVEFI